MQCRKAIDGVDFADWYFYLVMDVHECCSIPHREYGL